MKPTQQEIIELAREHATRYTNRHYPDKPVFTFTQDALQKVIELALERFGAGGGEPVNQWRKVGTGQWWDGFPDHSDGGGPYETRTLYTRPYPTDLRAEYLRGLEDAAKVADANATDARTRHAKFRCVNIAEAIRALKGKQ